MVPRALRPPLRLIRVVVLWTVIGLAIGFGAFAGASELSGNRTFNMLTGSMSPAIRPGDVVVDEVIRPSEARVGDVVTFPDPRRRERLITHRVKSVSVSGRYAYFVTRGDDNDTSERWNIPAGGEIGRVAYLVPRVAYARRWLGGRSARIVAIALLVVAGLAVLVEVWRRPAPVWAEASGGQS
jgi:signal peptidase